MISLQIFAWLVLHFVCEWVCMYLCIYLASECLLFMCKDTQTKRRLNRKSKVYETNALHYREQIIIRLICECSFYICWKKKNDEKIFSRVELVHKISLWKWRRIAGRPMPCGHVPKLHLQENAKNIYEYCLFLLLFINSTFYHNTFIPRL